MNHPERFRAVMNYQPVDRLPIIEWAMWWDLTIARWKNEGLPKDLDGVFEIAEYFGLDPYKQFWFSTTEQTIDAEQHHVEGSVATMDDYLSLRPHIFPDHGKSIESMRPWAKRQAEGDAVVWITLEGFFWFPRTLMGFERQMIAFCEEPEIIHTINEDLLEFNLDILQRVSKSCVPTFITIAEDMSYNHGPMLSQAHFEEFLAPYYRRLIPVIQDMNMIPIVDTDGDVTDLAPWLLDVGVLGILPLERQAGVDGMKLRQQFPNLRMIGHYDKMVMASGRDALRAEFERLLPLMKTGGFIPSVDHQTPPHIPIDQYREYLTLLREYAQTAVA
jgi:hypothetical protein